MLKTSKSLLEANVRIAALEAERARSIEQHNELNREYREAVRNFDERLRDAHSEMHLLRSQLDEVTSKGLKRQIDNAVLKERLDLLTNYFSPGAGTRLQGPTVMSEEAEDAMFAFRQGDINKGELERELVRAGYDNTEIEFELSDYPRHATDQ